MDRHEISRIAHTNHPVAAPISTARLRALVQRATHGVRGRVLDVGCGSGEWLLEILTTAPRLVGTGVDLHPHPDLAAKSSAAGVADRVTWVEADAATWHDGEFDLVVCVGASHAFGGLEDTLRAVRDRLRPGGRCLLGDAVWENPPSPAALAELGAGPDDFTDLPGFADRAMAHGFELGEAHISSLEEWDDYEWSWSGSLTEWALDSPREHPDREQALEVARAHRRGWLGGYRGQLGFVTAVLHDTRSA
ncbi:MAG: class I SAM-dependent methyltransferase [Ornithinibacter sp.]